MAVLTLLRSTFASAVILAGLVLFGQVDAASGAAPSLEYPIKATFLDKFGDFITWPTEAAPTFSICVLGLDPFGPIIDQALRDKVHQGRPIALARVPDAAAARACHILYIGKTDATAAVLTALAGNPVLTVTDAASWNGTPRGMIHFVVSDNRVRFIIDDAAAAAAGLTISSKLLAVATAVNPRAKAGTP